MVKRGRSWTEVSSNCRVGLIIEMSVAAFVSESLGTSAGPAGMELLLNTIYFLKHLDQQELALCLGNLFCFACSWQAWAQTQQMGSTFISTDRDKGWDIHGVMLMGWVLEPWNDEQDCQCWSFCCAWLRRGNSLNICQDIWGELWAQGWAAAGRRAVLEAGQVSSPRSSSLAAFPG